MSLKDLTDTIDSALLDLTHIADDLLPSKWEYADEGEVKFLKKLAEDLVEIHNRIYEANEGIEAEIKKEFSKMEEYVQQNEQIQDTNPLLNYTLDQLKKRVLE